MKRTKLTTIMKTKNSDEAHQAKDDYEDEEWWWSVPS